ncbi:Serpin B6 [Harpegnathos saltator]|uniref:Serpin B6 n=1 Tax=Harpegnathos saltator TaxID=610380 RepID=E2BRP4_HARSA|nr:Serpin B6 [Harpegnathos saltator]
MLPQRLRWLLPALIVSWMHLQLAAASPVHDERSSHVSASAFGPSVATSTMTRQDYNKRRHPPDGKNDTQSGHKLVASPAGLLRPDKFQFYTYNDKGDMITRQMTVQEIQGLIAAGGADHVAMDRQEPQKADDVLTGGKKVMDVVQKVQNVLKSALDKPPILTGSVPKIPEHANVEWSNILPSILSGEADAISPSGNEPPRKSTTERTEAGSGITEYISPGGSVSAGIKTNATSSNPAKPAAQSDVQTSAYGGFANNVGHNERPQYIHYPQQTPPAGAFSEKPMIPVPVITLTEQKLSTLQSAVTESPVFQMLSVIPVGTTESAHHQQDQTVNPTANAASQTEVASQTEHFVELALSKVPDTSTSSQPPSSAAQLVNTPNRQTTADHDDKASVGASTVMYLMTTPGVSTTSSSAVDIKQTAGYNGPGEAMTSENNTKPFVSKPSFALGVSKEPEVNGTRDDEKIISQTNIVTSQPLSHASEAPKPEDTPDETVLHSHSPSTFSVSKTETSTVPNSPDTDGLNTSFSRVTEKSPVNSITPTYTKDHLRPTETQSSVSMEPLPTQLIDSFSSVMSQISEAKPPILPLSSTGRLPELTIVNVSYDQRHNVSDDSIKDSLINADIRYDTLTMPLGIHQEKVEHVGSQPTVLTTVAARLPPLNIVTRIPGFSTVKFTTSTQRPTAMATDKVSIMKAGMNNVSLRPSHAASSTTEAMEGDGVAANNNVAATSSANVKSTDTTTSRSTTSKSTTSSPVWVQLEKIQNVSLENLTESPATLGTVTVADAILQKHTPDGASSPEGFFSSPVTSPTLDATKTQSSTSAFVDMSTSLKRPTPTKEYFDYTLMNVNLSDPVSAVDQVLSIAPLPSSTPTVEQISLPDDTSSLTASELASGLIAGFASSTSERSPIEELGGGPIVKNASSASTARPTVLSDRVTKPVGTTQGVTETHKQTMAINVTANRQEAVTQTSTRPTLVTSPVKSSTAESSTLTKEQGLTWNDKNISTTRPAKLPNANERIDDSTEVPSSFLLGDSASTGSSKADVGPSTVGVVTASPERLSTANIAVRPSNKNQTLPHASSNQDKKDNREKVKTTEAPVVRTDVASESSTPAKVASVVADGGDTRNRNSSVHIGGGSKVETSGEKNQSFASASLTTQQSIVVHQNLSSHVADSVNDTKSELHAGSAEHRSNVTADAGAANITFSSAKLPAGNSSSSTLAQNASRVSNATTPEKMKGSTTPMAPYATTKNRTTVTSRPLQSTNKTDHNVNSSTVTSSSDHSAVQEAVHTDRPIIKVATQSSSSGNMERPSRPSLANGTNSPKPADKTSSPSDKNMPPQRTTQSTPMEKPVASESPSRNTSTSQMNEQSNNTESKPASLKHSENSAKPDVTRPPSPMSNGPARPAVLKPTVSHKPLEKSDVSKTEANVNSEEKWTLISQQVPPAVTKLPKPSKPLKPLRKPPFNPNESDNVRAPGADSQAHQQDDPSQTMLPQSVLPLDASQGASGLDVTVKHTSADIVNFAKLCNELAFNFWVSTNKGLSTARSLALSPFGMTSLLAMIFLGARGPTSDQMNEVLGLDDVATFNPHLVFQNITDTVSLARGQGIANAAFVRELFADKMKVRKLMPFYKEQAQQFYEGLVAEVNFATISDLVRRRTNLLIRKQTGGRIKDFVKTNTVPLRSPLAALSANVFQTDCNTSLTSSVGRDGELYFAVSPAVRQRRLVPVPATTWRSGVLAGYEPSIDATAVALGGSDRLVSTIFVLPGQQGHTAPGDTLDRLEQRLVRSAFRDGTWNKLLKVLIPRSGLELQVPKFSHRSVVNATAALKRMGLDELFSGNADFKGINGVGHRLHLADVLQMNLFSTCGDENILSGRHHVETYPGSPLRRRVEDIDGGLGHVTEDDVSSSQEEHTSSLHAGRLPREKRQISTTSERPRLKLDRPFLYFVRHNPSGIILHMGRFNPRLLP